MQVVNAQNEKMDKMWEEQNLRTEQLMAVIMKLAERPASDPGLEHALSRVVLC